MGQYTRLSLNERQQIQSLSEQGYRHSEIAEELGRSKSTILRELKPWKGKIYRPRIAHVQSKKRQASRKLGKRKIDTALGEEIEHLLCEKHFSPEQINHHLKNQGKYSPSHEAIYQYIYSLEGERRKKCIAALRRRRKYRRRKTGVYKQRGRIPNMRTIHERAPSVETRKEIGHWEGDLIIGKQHGSALLTLVERMTRYTLIVLLQADKTSEAVVQACIDKLSALPQELRKTLTYDRGKEMTLHEQLTQAIETQVYFADPHSPWQRGSNENTNGLIRDFFPKGSDFREHTVEEVAKVEHLLNIRPRKVLGFRTPKQAFSDYLNP
jgi:transposase, IS30 family